MAKAKGIGFFQILIIIAVFVSAGLLAFYSEFKHVTGYGASLATVRVNVSSQLDITLIDANITFGNGIVNLGTTPAQLDTTFATANWTGSGLSSDPFILENKGNVLANVSVTPLKTAASWIGGSNFGPGMYINYTNMNYSGGAIPLVCLLDGGVNGVAVNQTNNTWINITTAPVTNLCQKMNYSDTSDDLRIDLRITIPIDAPTTAAVKVNSFTFSATQSV